MRPIALLALLMGLSMLIRLVSGGPCEPNRCSASVAKVGARAAGR